MLFSETAGTALLSGEAVDVGQPLRLRAWNLLSSKANDAAALRWEREWNWISMSYSISRH